ncbi:sensor histidine kinase [Flindersiella endophytica]
MRDVLLIVAIAGAWSAAIGVIGLLAVPALRKGSVRRSLVAIAVVAVLAFVAGLLGTAQAMFLSPHDFQVTLIVIAPAGLVSFTIAMLLAGQLAKDSRALGAAARTFGEAGSYTPPDRTPSVELAEVSRELEAASRKLAESRQREQALEASRRDLVAWVSHDLRTPLAGLRAMAEALEDGVAEDPRRYHKRMRVEVDRLTRMVDDLFELARIHAGALQLTLSQVSLPDLVSDTLAGADPLARAKGVRLSGHAGRLPGSVRADARELSRVLTNLVTNAIQHTPHDGAVVVEAGAQEGVAVLSVTDACGGIPDGDLDHVFEVAWRGSTARTPAPGEGDRGGVVGPGAGLGLAIVRGIVEAHQGSVQVRNIGQGCRFEVRLPLGVA